MDSRVQELIRQSERLFSSRGNLLAYWQELAENFYPERADFTSQRTESDWWTGLMSSEPVLKRRDLANLIQSVARSEDGNWFEVHLANKQLDADVVVRRWLDYIGDVQRSAMYHPPAMLTRTTKLTDNDWVTFGNAVIEVDIRRDMPSLIYRAHHLRDIAWMENAYGEIDTVYRRWKPTAKVLVEMFGDKCAAAVKKAAKETPDQTIDCCHVLRPRQGYEDKPTRTPKAQWISIYFDKENGVILEETPQLWFKYVIPRWQMIAGSQYAWSPATGPGLADARTLQQVVLTLLEAGEKAVDPPMVAYEEALRSDINIYARGITLLDRDYDERTGDPIRPLVNDRSGLPFGLEMHDRFNSVLHRGFFLDRMELPPDQGKMTAYEVRKRLEEHIRQTMPLLAPLEDEYSAKLCEKTFEVLRIMKAFGPEENLPDVLRGQDIIYEFQSPIRTMSDELKAQKLLEGINIVTAAGQLEPVQIKQLRLDRGVREALEGAGIPAEWIEDAQTFSQIKAEMEKAQRIAQGMQAIQQGAQGAQSVAGAQQMLTQGQ